MTETLKARVMRFLLLIVAFLLPSILWAEKVALVIGNGAYRSVAALDNPGNDARSIAQALVAQGFDVTLVEDQTRAQMLSALRSFRSSADGAEIAMLYYAGHGIEIGGRNYLIPVDAQVADERDARLEMIELDDALAQLSGAQRMKMVVLDACRDNPFVTRMKSENKGRNVGRGLAIVNEADADTLIAYAAAAGDVTPDGAAGGNSPFTQAFLSALESPPADVRLLLGRVRDQMRRNVPGAAPFVYSSLGGDAYVINPNSLRPDSSAQADAPDPNAIIRDFATAEIADDPEVWRTFLTQYAALADHPLYVLALRRRDLPEREDASTQSRPEDSASETPKPPDRKDLLGRIQTALQSRNCYGGKIDGLYGRQTRSGLARLSAETGETFALDDTTPPDRMEALLTRLEALDGVTCPKVVVARKPVATTAAPAPTYQVTVPAEPTPEPPSNGAVFVNPPNYCPAYGSTAECQDGRPRQN